MSFTLAIIGGSGIYDIPGLADVREHELSTPYGAPSDRIIAGKLGDTQLLFLPRHARGHKVAPHEINFRANICALKKLGATHVVSLSAVGSMKEEIAPGNVVVVDQYIDLTKKRASTFFDGGIVAHVAFADPTCADLNKALALAAENQGSILHAGREQIVSQLGGQRDRDDRASGSKARSRSSVAIRHARPGDRLRLLARDRGRRLGRRDLGRTARQRRAGQAHGCRIGAKSAGSKAQRCQQRAQIRRHYRPHDGRSSR